MLFISRIAGWSNPILRLSGADESPPGGGKHLVGAGFGSVMDRYFGSARWSPSRIQRSFVVAKGRQGDGQGCSKALVPLLWPWLELQNHFGGDSERSRSNAIGPNLWIAGWRKIGSWRFVTWWFYMGLPSGNQTYTDTAMGNPHYINGVFLANIFFCKWRTITGIWYTVLFLVVTMGCYNEICGMG